MNKILELRAKRNILWEQAKNYLEDHRDENGVVSTPDLEQYDKLTAEVKKLGEEIRCLELQTPKSEPKL